MKKKESQGGLPGGCVIVDRRALRWVTGEPPTFRVTHPAILRPISQCIQYLTIASARCWLAPYAAHEAIAFEPAPSGGHCICPSSRINGSTVVGSDSSLARCRGCATIIVVLATFGVVCHAQMTPQDASGVTSCEAELASCQAVLGADGTKKAEDIVPLAAVTAKTGTPSSASKGARLRRSPPPIRLACTDCVRIDRASPCRAGSRALVGKNTSGAVQPAETAQYPQSNATSCAALLRDCRAHSSARMGTTSGGEPRPIVPISFRVHTYLERLRSTFLCVYM
jgi:hypothetical protein